MLGSLVRLTQTVLDADEGLDGRQVRGGANNVDDFDTQDAPQEQSNPRYSTAMTLEYYLARDTLIQQVWGGNAQGQTSIIQDYINDFVERKIGPVFDGRFPNADELLTNPDFLNGAWATRFRAAGAPPSFVYFDESGAQFLVTTLGNPGIYPINRTRADIEGAAPAGATGIDPTLTNPVQVEEPTQMGSGIFSDVQPISPGSGLTPDAEPPRTSTTVTSRLPEADRPPQSAVQGVTMNDVDADRRLANRVAAQSFGTNLPTFDTAALSNLLGRGRGGGGGGGGRQPLALDAEALKEATRQTYRRWYRQDPDDPVLERIVNEYSRKANAFWVGKGGRLDFEVFMRERLREEPQYERMFRYRPASVDEDRFVAEFEAGISQLGLRSSTAEDQIARSMQSGGSAESQMLRVSRTREASQQPGFARRLGSTVQQLGRLG